MSERNIEQMMVSLEHSERPDYNEKADEVIENFRGGLVYDFLRVYAAIQTVPVMKRKLFRKTIDVDKLQKRLHEFREKTLNRDQLLYHNQIVSLLEKSDEIFSGFKFKDELRLKPIYQAFLDGEVQLPNQSEMAEFEETLSNHWNLCIIPGQLRLHQVIAHLDDYLREIYCYFHAYTPCEYGEELVADKRPDQFYTIAYEAISQSNRSINLRSDRLTQPDHYTKALKIREEDIFPEGTIGRMKLQGLTYREYLMMQINQIVAQIKKGTVDKTEVSLWDGGMGTDRTVLLGSKIVEGDVHKRYITGVWQYSTRVLEINTDSDERGYYPRLAIGFGGGSNE